MSRTDPRVIKTLQRIDDSLLENLNNYEFRKTTVDMLCRSAKVNRSTFYKYYTDKFELLNDYLNRILNEFDEATTSTGFVLAAPYTISGKGYIRDLRDTLDFIYEHREIYRILWKATIGRPIYQEMEDIVCKNILEKCRKGIESSEEEADPYNELYARLYASNWMTLVRWWLKHEPAISREEVEAVMEGNIQKGLLATFASQ